MTELILIRHAQSTVNTGHSTDVDCCLTDLGREQAGRLGELLAQHDLSGFVPLVSPYRRTRETAHSIAKATGLRFIPDFRIREWGAECQLDGVRVYAETAEQLMQRLGPFYEWAENQKLLIVTHGACVDLLKRLATATPITDHAFGPGIPNACCFHICDGELTDLSPGV
ncbi:MAG TPA: histidine phosphatase family protein [Tepidisphaeraceae bacterium]|jgi:broad specificity phosphatase PhoE|nr:histidine phosphatase family protein [Tepidisphaeraceae bacterium]